MAAPTSFRGEPDHFEPSMALGISQRLQATRAAAKGVGGGVATTPSWPLLPSSRLQLASYLNATLALLESSSDPQAALAELRAFKCAEYLVVKVSQFVRKAIFCATVAVGDTASHIRIRGQVPSPTPTLIR